MGIVKVIKRVVNDDGGTNRASDFRIRVTSENSPPVNFRGAPTPGVDVMVNPGAFSVTEQIDSRYDTTTTLDGRLQQCLGTIRAGQTVTCTITNNDKPTAFLRVIKTVVNNDGANKRPSDFNIKVFGNNPSDSSFPGESYPGDIIRIGPGDYRVRENQDSRYVTTYSLQCSGTILEGQTRTCTILNNDKPFGSLRVIVNVRNDNGGQKTAQDFRVRVSGNDPSDSVFRGSGSPGTEIKVGAGSFRITQDTDPSYKTLYSLGCQGSIVVRQIRACTITNDDLKNPPVTQVSQKLPAIPHEVETIKFGRSLFPANGTIGHLRVYHQ